MKQGENFIKVLNLIGLAGLILVVGSKLGGRGVHTIITALLTRRKEIACPLCDQRVYIRANVHSAWFSW